MGAPCMGSAVYRGFHVVGTHARATVSGLGLFAAGENAATSGGAVRGVSAGADCDFAARGSGGRADFGPRDVRRDDFARAYFHVSGGPRVGTESSLRRMASGWVCGGARD